MDGKDTRKRLFSWAIEENLFEILWRVLSVLASLVAYFTDFTRIRSVLPNWAALIFYILAGYGLLAFLTDIYSWSSRKRKNLRLLDGNWGVGEALFRKGKQSKTQDSKAWWSTVLDWKEKTRIDVLKILGRHGENKFRSDRNLNNVQHTDGGDVRNERISKLRVWLDNLEDLISEYRKH